MTVTRYVGTCPVCERYHRVHKQRTMVHHGYRRPGGGQGIIGDCLGVGWPAWELSPDGTIEYLKRVQQSILAAKDHLRSLVAGEVTQLSVSDGFERVSWGVRVPKYKTVTPADGAIFDKALRDKIAEVTGDIAMFQDTERYLQQKIPTWTLQPLITEEEELRRRESTPERLQRKAEKDAAREARQAKRDKNAAIQRARIDEKLALQQEYREIFNVLAFRVTDPATESWQLPAIQEEAKQHWIELQRRKSKKGYLDFYERDLGIDEALVTLKLAVADPRYGGGYRYANDLGWDPARF